MPAFEDEKTVSLPWNFYTQEAGTYGLPVELIVKHELKQGFNLVSSAGKRVFERSQTARMEVTVYEEALDEIQKKGISLGPNDILALLRASHKRDCKGAEMSGNLYVLTAVDPLPEISEMMLCEDRKIGNNPKIKLYQGLLKHIEL